MSNGEETVLKINPYGRDELTIDAGLDAVFDGTTPYLTPVQTVRLHEEQRLQVRYPDGGAGVGQTWHAYTPLVPFDLVVVIKSTTRAGLVSAYEDLARACVNPRGGLIEYQPDGASDSTYYHYIQSAPPKLRDETGNRWDAAPTSDGYHTMALDVSLMTRPYGTGDPDDPDMLDLNTSPPYQLGYLRHRVTLGGDYFAGVCAVDISASDLDGSVPPLLRLCLLAATDDLRRAILFAISGTDGDSDFDDFSPFYEATDATVIKGAWASAADSARFNDAYMECAPDGADQNDLEHGLRFTLSNTSALRGRFAIFGIAYDDTGDAGTWKHHVELKRGSDNNTLYVSPDRYTQDFFLFHLLYAGEVDIPPLPLSRLQTFGEDTANDLVLDWYSERTAGSSGVFSLDGILLIQLEDIDGHPKALDVYDDLADDEGLLIENFPSDDTYGRVDFATRAYIVEPPPAEDYLNTSTIWVNSGDIWRAFNAIRGGLPVLDPAKDHRLFGVFERDTWDKEDRFNYGDDDSLDDWTFYNGSDWTIAYIAGTGHVIQPDDATCWGLFVNRAMSSDGYSLRVRVKGADQAHDVGGSSEYVSMGLIYAHDTQYSSTAVRSAYLTYFGTSGATVSTWKVDSAGSATSMGSIYVSTYDYYESDDDWSVIGIMRVSVNEFRAYFASESYLDDDDDIFNEDFLAYSFSDASPLIGSRFGLYFGLGSATSANDGDSFDNVKFRDLTHLVRPTDYSRVTLDVLPRTIAPFD